MKIHILGACGTFMGGVAMLARRAGHEVSGADQHTYPPMSTLLESEGIVLHEGYHEEPMYDKPDLVIIGNALSRGNPAVEYVLNQNLNYTSGPRWLGENYLRGKQVIAVAGTHGKTTTSSMVAWILEVAGLNPGFLIGGVPQDFNVSAREGSGYFVVESDEYDTAFFDKRSKFVHYRPQVAILNNLEYDHADIFPDLAAIETQFHHLIRTIPGNGTIISNGADSNLERVLARGCWSNLQRFSFDDKHDWRVEMTKADGSELRISYQQEVLGTVEWGHCGRHNAMNAVTAIAAAVAVGVPAATAIKALSSFSGVRRRMELILEVDHQGREIHVYDDFAHHPTAIEMTLQGLQARGGQGRLVALIEPRSNTMRMGEHRESLAAATSTADQVFWFQPAGMDWSLESVVGVSEVPATLCDDVDELVKQVAAYALPGDQLVIMSNGSFSGVHQKLLAKLKVS